VGREEDSAQQRYEAICRTLLSSPGVTRDVDSTQTRSRFGSSALKVNDRIFAMLVKGSLVVKLPTLRVDALAASGGGERYDAGRGGRPMKEWLTLTSGSEEEWESLAREALEFVAHRSAA